MKQYELFGLKVESEIELDEVPTGIGGDVLIKRGIVERPKEAVFAGDVFALQDQLFYLDVPGVGRFQVENGETITVDADPEATNEQLKLYILGSCFGCLLHQRHIIPLHGSVLDVEGRGVLITGMSGAGKSTVANALIARGFPFVTDDVAAVTFETGEPFVHLAYPSQKLWEDVVDRWDIVDKRAVTRQVEGRTKFSVVRKQEFAKAGVPLRVMIELVPVEGETELEVLPITGMEKIKTLISHTYRTELVSHLRPNGAYLQQILTLAEQLQIFRIKRPVGVPLENKICDQILEQVRVGVESRHERD